MEYTIKTYVKGICSSCKRSDRKNHAKGLCRICYSNQWNKQSRKKAKEFDKLESYAQVSQTNSVQNNVNKI